jgi:hypothetical protein
MPVGRYGCSAAVNSEGLWVIHGGISRCQDYILSDTYEFNFRKRQWSAVACQPSHRNPCVLVPRTGHVGVRSHTRVPCVGGSIADLPGKPFYACA